MPVPRDDEELDGLGDDLAFGAEPDDFYDEDDWDGEEFDDDGDDDFDDDWDDDE